MSKIEGESPITINPKTGQTITTNDETHKPKSGEDIIGEVEI